MQRSRYIFAKAKTLEPTGVFRVECHLKPPDGYRDMDLRKINTIGLAQANKAMHLSAIAYNLKKYLKFDQKRVKIGAGKLALAALVKRTFQLLFGPCLKHRKLAFRF